MVKRYKSLYFPKGEQSNVRTNGYSLEIGLLLAIIDSFKTVDSRYYEVFSRDLIQWDEDN